MPRRSGLSINEPAAELQGLPVLGTVRLEVWPRDSGTINQSEWLVLTGSSPSETDARRVGIAAWQALQRAFSRLRVAADFGAPAATGGLGEAGRQILEEATGRPVLDDEHGLLVHAAEPAPRFVSVGALTLKLSAQADRLHVALSAALAQGEPVTDQESIAYDLFAASFFDSSPDSRLISLVTAVETLIDPPDRSPAARSHVERIIEATRKAVDLTKQERDSLVGGLRWLLRDSITATGREFLRSRLGDRMYGDATAPQLWARSYDLRSRLVHGYVPRPSREDVGRCAASLEVLVAHLLSGRLLAIEV